MSLWSRIANALHSGRLSREIDEELRSHLREAVEEGRDPAEARRALGSVAAHREHSRDIRLIPWLDSLRADAVFGWRQLKKKKITSAAAILSLALAMGACTSAFRLIDALFLRALPIAHPERLYDISRQTHDSSGAPLNFGWSYPLFHQMRTAVKDRAELVAVSYAERTQLTFSSDEATEKAHMQYVSGGMFRAFGLHPALGRLLMESDDAKPGTQPYVILSYSYWSERFGRDPKVIGRTFRMANDLYEIVGVGPEGFTGTEPGTRVDFFLPAMMFYQAMFPDNTWLRTLALMKPGFVVEPVRQRLNAVTQGFERERAKAYAALPKQSLDRFLKQKVLMEPAPEGVSTLQKDNRRALMIFAALVGLVLLIACANVANLMTAQAAARSREMALRVSIGAGRGRLLQLVLMESVMLALFSAAAGMLFAWWSVPFVVSRINPPDNPVQLDLAADWRVLGFGIALALAVAMLFGLLPALGASAVKPSSALKGGEDPRSRARSMNALIAGQAAFCFLVLFVAGLFVATFDRLSHRQTGFSAERILTLDAGTLQAQPTAKWDQAIERLRAAPGVGSAAFSGWPLLVNYGWNGFVSINDGAPSSTPSYFLSISPGWIDEMKIGWIDGRDFRPGDAFPNVAIVNEAFARQYFNGENPVGKSFEKVEGRRQRPRIRIVGLVRDASYRNLREPMLPVAYVPFHVAGPDGGLEPVRFGTFIVRTLASNPLALANALRRRLKQAEPELRVYEVSTQAEINREQTIRERLLATLALFFAIVALLLAGVGLYGVLDYSVLQRRREIAIRIAIGARASHIATRVTTNVLVMVSAGAVVGLALGLASARYVESLLYGVKAVSLEAMALPALLILAIALLAALPPMIRAVRIDPAQILRVE